MCIANVARLIRRSLQLQRDRPSAEKSAYQHGDFSPLLLRPFGYREVWVGYDPALTGDSAGLVVVAPPQVEGGLFRVLERHQCRGNDFEEQAEAIKQVT